MTKPYWRDENAISTATKHLQNIATLLQRTVNNFPFEAEKLTTEDITILIYEPSTLLREKVKLSLPTKKHGAFQIKADVLVDQIELEDITPCVMSATGLNTYIRSNGLTQDYLSFFILQDKRVMLNEIAKDNYIRSQFEAYATNENEVRLVGKVESLLEILTDIAQRLENKGDNYNSVREILNTNRMFVLINGQRFINPSWISEYAKAF